MPLKQTAFYYFTQEKCFHAWCILKLCVTRLPSYLLSCIRDLMLLNPPELSCPHPTAQKRLPK